jgi:hydroxymethylpyrimidine/phosphomethylpyrimidine kinase
MFIFVDESGDLGFDFTKKGTSSHFAITLLVCKNQDVVKSFNQAVKRTLKNKLKAKRKNIFELKGWDTTI